MPIPGPKEARMHRNIVVGYDDSDQAKDALALGTVLAGRLGVPVPVVPPEDLQ